MIRSKELRYLASKQLVDGDLEEAIKNYKFSLSIDPNNPFTLNAIGFTYDVCGKFDEAEKFYKHSLEINPDNIPTRNRLAEVYLKQNEFDKALQEQIKILKKFPKDIRARVGLGNSYICMKRFDDAIKEHSTVIKQRLNTSISLGWTSLFSAKNYDRKTQISDRIIERSDMIIAYCGLIKSHYEKKEFSKSMKYFSQLKLFKFKTKAVDILYSLKP